MKQLFEQKIKINLDQGKDQRLTHILYGSQKSRGNYDKICCSDLSPGFLKMFLTFFIPIQDGGIKKILLPVIPL